MRTHLRDVVALRLVTGALPPHARDGDEVYFLADATNGVVWHLRYRASSPSAYKWEFVGGGELFSEYNGGTGGDTSYVNQTAYIDMGPSVTCPLAGEYVVDIAASISAGGANLGVLVGVKVGSTEAADFDWIEFYTGGASAARLHGRRTRKVTVTAASTRFELRARATSAFTFNSRYRELRARPLRVR